MTSLIRDRDTRNEVEVDFSNNKSQNHQSYGVFPKVSTRAQPTILESTFYTKGLREASR
jgi:hypothetical protein